MKDIIEIYDNYKDIGIINRKITEGEEINLVRDYIKFRKESFSGSSTNKMAIFLESKVGNAYPDVVFVEYNPQNYDNWNKHREELNKSDLKILYHIYSNQGLQASEINFQLGVGWKNLLLSLEKLYDANLITRFNSMWQIVDENRIVTHKIEAYEAKLNKWEQLLQQAIVNKNFASESYALSVIESVPRRETLNKFKKFGIGVCVKEGDSFNLVKPAHRTKIPVSFNSIMFNEWIGRLINVKG